MWYPSSESDVLARPDQQLTDHLSVFCDVSPVVPDVTTGFGGSRKELAEIAGQLHDFGKITPEFQNYIHERQDDGGAHAPLSAAITLYALDELGWSVDEQLVGFVAVARHHNALPDARDYLRNIADADNSSYKSIADQIESISETDLAVEAANNILTEIDDQLSWSGFRDWLDLHVSGGRYANHGFNNLRRRISLSDSPPFVAERPDLIDSRFYGVVMQIWGCICLFDRMDASGVTPSADVLTGTSITNEPIENYINSESSIENNEIGDDLDIDGLRGKARSDVLSNTEDFVDSSDTVATLTLPTGLGKTLTGLSAAIKIQDSLPDPGRIIYALPYTSVINQTAAELMDIYHDNEDRGLEEKSENLSEVFTGDQITIHHHLSETKIESEAANADPSSDYILGEAWRSGCVLTTFVQVFESLLGPTTAESFKLPALSNSVLLLDEPQALPERFRPVARRLIDLLTEQYNARVILMTATRPGIIDDELMNSTTQELATDPEQEYFDVLDRVSFHLTPAVQSFIDGDETAHTTYFEAAERIIRRGTEGDDVLAICNTKRSARRLYDTVRPDTGIELGSILEAVYDDFPETESKETIGEHTLRRAKNQLANSEVGDVSVYAHLTTLHRPRDQSILLEVATDLIDDEGVSVTMVATQLVEAGVDVSFDVVYRDIAPLDSIVQAAGRCNREGLGGDDSGDVVVCRFPPADGEVKDIWDDGTEYRVSFPSETVYDRDINSTRVTADVLRGLDSNSSEFGTSYRSIGESTVAYAGIEKYYSEVAQRLGSGHDLPDAVDRCDAATLGQESVIEQEGPEVIVARQDHEIEKVEEFESSLNAENSGGVEGAESVLSELGECRVSALGYADSVSDGEWVEVGGTELLVVVEGRCSEALFDGVFGVCAGEVGGFPSTLGEFEGY